ncbi:hypothetical protein LINPERHAP1_LOCUS40740, partial [Linum perenne]
MMLWYMSGKKRMIASSLAAICATVVALVILVVLLHYLTVDSRGKLVETILILTSFTQLSAIEYDMAPSELSIVTCLLGLLGSAFLFIYKILFKNKIILSRHCIAMLGNIVLLFVICRTHHARHRVALLSFIESAIPMLSMRFSLIVSARRSSALRTVLELEIEAPSIPDLEIQSSILDSDEEEDIPPPPPSTPVALHGPDEIPPPQHIPQDPEPHRAVEDSDEEEDIPPPPSSTPIALH